MGKRVQVTTNVEQDISKRLLEILGRVVVPGRDKKAVVIVHVGMNGVDR